VCNIPAIEMAGYKMIDVLWLLVEIPGVI